MTDFQIEDHGTIFLVRPLTDGATDWINDNVDTEGADVQWMGNAVVVEHRYVEDLAGGLTDAGFTVEAY